LKNGKELGQIAELMALVFDCTDETSFPVKGKKRENKIVAFLFIPLLNRYLSLVDEFSMGGAAPHPGMCAHI
jgi:hypothetical protein